MYLDFIAQANVSDVPMTDQEAAGVFAILGVFLALLAVSYIIRSYALSKIFEKAGQQGWKAWVPVYNHWILLQLGGQAGWWSLMLFVPFVNIVAIVFLYMAMYYVGLKLQKTAVFLLLALLLPIVWYLWLAFDSSKWKESAGPNRLDTPSDASARA